MVAFGLLSWLLVTPGLISRYLVYAVVFTILCRTAFSTFTYFVAVGVLTAIALAGAAGHLSLDFLGYSGSANVMSPTNNAISHFLFDIFSSDRFITLASLSNIAICIALGFRAWQNMRPKQVPMLATAPAGG
jgi:hypothetical protein